MSLSFTRDSSLPFPSFKIANLGKGILILPLRLYFIFKIFKRKYWYSFCFVYYSYGRVFTVAPSSGLLSVFKLPRPELYRGCLKQTQILKNVFTETQFIGPFFVFLSSFLWQKNFLHHYRPNCFKIICFIGH